MESSGEIRTRMQSLSLACSVCLHDHSSPSGVCGVCGHLCENSRLSPVPKPQFSEILPNFLYFGCFNAARSTLLLEHGISRVLNTVSSHQYCNKACFSCYYLPGGKLLPFNDAIQFLDECKKDKDRVFVHCMTGRSRSPAIVIAYLMRSKQMKFREAYAWLKERVPSVDLSPEFVRQLEEFEQKPVESCSSEHNSAVKKSLNAFVEAFQEAEAEAEAEAKAEADLLKRNSDSVERSITTTYDPVLANKPRPQKQKLRV